MTTRIHLQRPPPPAGGGGPNAGPNAPPRPAVAAVTLTFGELVVSVVSNEAYNLALRAQLLGLQNSKWRRRNAAWLVYSLVVAGVLQGRRLGSLLLLLGFWNVHRKIVLPFADSVTADDGHAATAAAAEFVERAPELGMCPAELAMAYRRAWSSKVLQLLYACVLLVTEVMTQRRLLSLVALAAFVLKDAGTLALRYCLAPVPAMRNGSVRARVFLILVGQETVATVLGPQMDPRWSALWTTVRIESDARRHVYLTALKRLVDKWLAATVESLFLQSIRLHTIESAIESANNAATAAAAAPAAETTTAAPPKEESLAWLRAHGARLADAWWGTEGDLCTVCLCALGNGSPVASFPCASGGNDVQLHHRHVFHADCLCEWLSSRRHTRAQQTCPLCRSAAAPALRLTGDVL